MHIVVHIGIRSNVNIYQQATAVNRPKGFSRPLTKNGEYFTNRIYKGKNCPIAK